MKDSYYFQHDSNARNDMKIIKLKRKYGAKGYGIYFQIIEMLRESNDFVMSFDVEILSYELRENLDEIKDILENFGLFTIKNGKFWSESLKRRMAKLNEIREKRKEAGIKGSSNKWQKTETKNEYNESKKL